MKTSFKLFLVVYANKIFQKNFENEAEKRNCKGKILNTKENFQTFDQVVKLFIMICVSIIKFPKLQQL